MRQWHILILLDTWAVLLAQMPAKIEYRVSEAEGSGIEARSVDLVTVASAIHWFDLNKFYTEVRRVVGPGVVMAAWTYYTAVFGSAIDALIERLVHEVLAADSMYEALR